MTLPRGRHLNPLRLLSSAKHFAHCFCVDFMKKIGVHSFDVVSMADAARDAGGAAEAAALYRQACAQFPHRYDLRVQLANMLKDSGAKAEAEALYRALIEERPQDADVRVQLGHLLKQCGLLEEAIASYRAAFDLDPSNIAAQAELGAAGLLDGEGAGVDARLALAGLAVRVSDLVDEVARMRALLPDPARIVAYPPDGYGRLRRETAIPIPPEGDAAELTIVVDLSGPPCDAREAAEGFFALSASLRDQTYADWTAIFVTDEPEARAAILRTATADARFRLVEPGSPHWEGALADGWMVFLNPSARLETRALAWVARLAACGGADAVLCDEERVELLNGLQRRIEPILRSCPDFDRMLAAGVASGLTAIRGTALSRQPDGPLDERVALALLAAAGAGRAAVVPLPLLSRRRVVPEAMDQLLARAAASASASGQEFEARPSTRFPTVLDIGWPSEPGRRIGVITLTRDHAEDAELFVASLRETATHPDRLRFLIIDTGAETVGARAALDRLASTEAVQVQRRPEPFNWSGLNNAGVAESEADLLLFANDDMRMLSPGWDDRIAGQLSRTGVGAVGARLLYPSGRIQHAGVLMGWEGLTIHDGLGAPESDAGPESRWIAPRAVAAIDGAFLATTRALFERLGGFDDAQLPIAFADVDYGLRLRAQGYRLIFEPHVEVEHHEGKTRGVDWDDPWKEARFRAEAAVMRRRWRKWMDIDPSVNPHWAEIGQPFRYLRIPPAEALSAWIALCASGDPWRVNPSGDS